VGLGARVGAVVAEAAAVGDAPADAADVGEVAGVGDRAAEVAVGTGVEVRETGVTVAGAAKARVGEASATNPERLTRRKK
jgi:hypothetical protein